MSATHSRLGARSPKFTIDQVRAKIQALRLTSCDRCPTFALCWTAQRCTSAGLCARVQCQCPGVAARATSSAPRRHRSFRKCTSRICPTRAASRRLRALKSRALDWRYPRKLRKPPSRWMFNVWQMNKAEKRFRCSSMNRIISDVSGRVRMRKKLRRLSTTRWCREADGFLDAAWHLCHKVLRQPFSNVSFTSSGLVPIASLCATKHPALVPRSWRLPAWTCSPLGCDLLPSGRLGSSHPGQIFLGMFEDFPIYSNGTKPGALH
ncbi:hypothetical protein FRC0538_00367 [Corynebacterium diphtheriae]|nr:hypothetical protein FRC0538_00367 [Corynebacterium diphtheriae]